jgi:carboxypeptidase T
MQTSPWGRLAPWILSLIVCLAFGSASGARSASAREAVSPPVELLQVTASTTATRDRLQGMGLDIVEVRPGVWVRLLGWPGDRERLLEAGFDVQVLEADYGRARARAQGVTAKPAPARPASLPAFGNGSMAGFYTTAEVDAYLDSMATHDTAGIVSSVVVTGTSGQGRPIRAIRIANESAPDHSRPRVLYTALTHAREPGGMQNLLYFIDQLVQRYGVDPDFTYLVDQRELWFVPIVNPDGYAINENTFFGSGSYGLWRKNARDNNSDGQITGADGVDLNRNFGYQWGYDSAGSSGTPASTTYRGPAAFSEPETQVLRDFCILHGFSMAQNFHTYHETTLYPWAYSGSTTPDHASFVRWADDMMRDSHYSYGLPVEILYPVNGDSNDWMYGDQVAKPKVFAMTTEAGDQNDEFWPPASRILPIAYANLRSNVVLAYIAGVYVHAEAAALVSGDGWLHPDGDAQVSITLRNDGLLSSNGAVTVTATTTTPGITITDPTSTFANMAAGSIATPAGTDLLGLHADGSVAAGTIVPLALEIRDAGSFVRHDTTCVTVGAPLVVFADDASAGLGHWTSTGGWGIQTVSGNPLFSDSPSGNYAANADTRLTLASALDLSGGAKAFLEFTTQWDIEGGYDFGRVEVSTNGGSSWTALPGRLTRSGHGTTGGYAFGTQTLGVPGYDATQRFMVPERIDLSNYAGLTDVRLRFRLTSDSGVQEDGWMIDDVQVLVYPMDATDVEARDGGHTRIAFETAGVNPFRSSTRWIATFEAPTRFRAAVYSVDGRLVRVLAAGIAAPGSRELVWDGRASDGAAVASGTYLVRLESDAGTLTRRVVRLR